MALNRRGNRDPAKSGSDIELVEEGVLEGRSISRKRKGNVYSSCVIPASMNAQGTMAYRTQQEKVNVSENNLVKRIMGVKTAD